MDGSSGLIQNSQIGDFHRDGGFQPARCSRDLSWFRERTKTLWQAITISAVILLPQHLQAIRDTVLDVQVAKSFIGQLGQVTLRGIDVLPGSDNDINEPCPQIAMSPGTIDQSRIWNLPADTQEDDLVSLYLGNDIGFLGRDDNVTLIESKEFSQNLPDD